MLRPGHVVIQGSCAYAFAGKVCSRMSAGIRTCVGMNSPFAFAVKTLQRIAKTLPLLAKSAPCCLCRVSLDQARGRGTCSGPDTLHNATAIVQPIDKSGNIRGAISAASPVFADATPTWKPLHGRTTCVQGELFSAATRGPGQPICSVAAQTAKFSPTDRHPPFASSHKAQTSVPSAGQRGRSRAEIRS